ncbi:glycoside hydrolase [Salegentibacter sp. JZCK2]|uniref:glycoside hydrolase family 113 n=1 Tax=Salegentibacter tibetensis TaxID=2873600 RepID=UPI001CCE0B1F|nr:glycoside hydrolase [Salegentibacter tibetensis]MBZ9731511.1 glycoside hydrolase [Salegentibacter tibetensis]
MGRMTRNGLEMSFNISRKFQMIKIFKCICLIFFITACSGKLEFAAKKINGLSLEASRDSLTEKNIKGILEVNPNAIALMPYAFLSDTKNPGLYFNTSRQWFGERVEGIEQAIFLLQSKDLQIMLKPHLWVRNGQFTGDINFSSEEDWGKFEDSYKEYILLYVHIAEKHKVEIFCIGTELYNFVVTRPEFWKDLILEIRKNYSGKLVYAENWDKVDQIMIWEDLDYVGVDAYFPLSSEAVPSKEAIKSGWKKHKSTLRDLSLEFQKPILFTEYGYRSMDYALKEPWLSKRGNFILNHNLQARALQVLYEEFWDENWFVGGFLWKWHQNENAGGIESDRFTPQNKPAKNVVQDHYGKFRN